MSIQNKRSIFGLIIAPLIGLFICIVYASGVSLIDFFFNIDRFYVPSINSFILNIVTIGIPIVYIVALLTGIPTIYILWIFKWRKWTAYFFRVHFGDW